MSGNANVFKKTGRNVSVSKNELVTVTIDKLMYYDSLTPKQKKDKKCPYTEPIFTKLDGGKTVQIPENIQKEAIIEWQTMKSKAGDDSKYSEAHTRLGRRERYLGQDPFIMNPDLTSSPSLTIGNEVDADYSTDNELSKLRSHERRSRSHVGGSTVPDQRYGSGGSYGDLPRDYEIFSRRLTENIGDYPDQRNINGKTHSNKVNPFSPNQYDEIQDDLLHASDSFDDQGIENCAPIEHMDDLVGANDNNNDNNDYDDVASCKTCEYDDTDDYLLDDENDQYDVKNGNYRYYDDTVHRVDPGYERTVTDMLERYDDNLYADNSSTYKYLFFFLLLVLIVLFINYKRNNGKFNFNMN